MKVWCTWLGALVSALHGYAQGTIFFDNRVLSAGINAPIFYGDSTAWGVAGGTRPDGTNHPTARAALYAGVDGTSEEQLVLVGAIVDFRTPVNAGYVNVGGQGGREIHGVYPGGYAIVQVRAWDGNDDSITSYEEALLVPNAVVGKSAVLRLVTGGGVNPAPPTPLYGLQSFGLYVVPEPSTWALIALGSLGLWVIRRKASR